MHQPDYRDPETGRAMLPWARLHSARHYHDMAAIAREFPGIRQTFNLTPVMLEQAEAAGRGEPEHLLDLCRADPGGLDEGSCLALLEWCFLADAERLVAPYPRYRELLERRGPAPGGKPDVGAARRFSAGDLRDLVVWFHLAWCPRFGAGAALGEELRRKERGFTADDRDALLEVLRAAAAEVVPAYASLAADGLAELSTTPYYHPIGPLLIDMGAAREAHPGAVPPARVFRGDRDAAWHLDRALASHAARFGAPPKGLWPAEGGVSDAFAALVADRGLAWMASDDQVLRESLRKSGTDGPSGAAHAAWEHRGNGGRPLVMVFRDHGLSDLIGFSYARWEAGDAAADFVRRALDAAPDAGGTPALVAVILDGENPWPRYPDGGVSFLRALYAEAERQGLETVTVSSFLERYPARRRLKTLRAGSWINHDFAVWAGHPEDLLAWEAVARVREAVLEAEATCPASSWEEAWRHLMAAEGSDWTWWYGEDHVTDQALEFDRLFRSHLIRASRLAGREPPEGVLRPIAGARRLHASGQPPRGTVDPVLDGRVTNYFEWLDAGRYDPSKHFGQMHGSRSIINHIYYSCTKTYDLVIRCDIADDGTGMADAEVVVRIVGPQPRTIAVPLVDGTAAIEGGRPAPGVAVARQSILEILVGAPESAREPWSFGVGIRRSDGRGLMELWPAEGLFVVSPERLGQDAEAWLV